MSFVHYEYLYLLIGLSVLLYYILKTKTVDVSEVFSKEVMEKILVKKKGFISKKTRLVMLLLALALMIIALARPVILQDEKQEKEVEGFNLVIALDISKSMNVKDIFPSRLEYAKHLIFKVMDELKEAKICVVAFSSDAFLVAPFSEDFKSIKFLVSNLNPEFISAKGSSMMSALRGAKKVYDAIGARSGNLLLISDGADGKEIQESISFAKESDLKVHVLNLGTQKGSSIEDENGALIKDKDGNIVISKRDDTIAKLSSSSGGSFLSIASSTNSLGLFTTQIRNASTKQKVKRDIYERTQELFMYPLVLSCVLVFFSFNSLRFFMLFLVILTCKDANAGMFDFLHVEKANESYKNKEYEKASKEFSMIDSNEAKYNEANALYKNKKYEKAQELYKSIKGFEKEKEYKRLHNLGNAYANLEQYDEAIKTYEEALKLKDDADTKYNLELLKEQKKKKEQENKQQNRDEKEQKKQENKDKEKKKNEQNQKDNDEKENSSEENKEDTQKQKEEEKQQSDVKNQEQQKKMSEAEAKKWEEKMQDKVFKTQPMKMEIAKRKSIENNW